MDAKRTILKLTDLAFNDIKSIPYPNRYQASLDEPPALVICHGKEAKESRPDVGRKFCKPE